MGFALWKNSFDNFHLIFRTGLWYHCLTMKLHKFLLTPPIVAISAALFCGALFAEDENTFLGTVDNDWFTPENWSYESVPSEDDDVVIDGKTVNVTNAITVGSLELKGAAKLTVKANEIPTNKYDEVFCDETTTLNALRKAACVVQIARNFTVGDTAVVYPEAAILTGVPVVFRVGGDFTLAEGASFNVKKRGWGWSTDAWDSRPSEYCKPLQREGGDPIQPYGWTLAIGSGRSWGLGGKYGGTATGSEWSGKLYGKSYGPDFAPLFPGSPAGAYKDAGGKKINPAAGRGPGSIVVLTSGKAKIDGVMDADGTKHVTGETYEHSGTSGGGIWLAAQDFSFGTNAKLTAIGGDKVPSPYVSGGGGRIALAIGCSQDEIDELIAGRMPQGAQVVSEINGVAVDVRGGARPDGTGRQIDGSVATVRSAHVPVELTLDVFGDGQVEFGGQVYTETTVIVVPTLTDLALKAVPDDGGRFVSWTGAYFPLGYLADNEITVNLTVPTRIAANFSGEKVSRVWTGPNGGDWTDGANWTPGGIPSADDDLYVTNATFTVTGPLACHGLTIAGNSKITFQALGFEEESTEGNLYAKATVVSVADRLEISGTAVVTVANDAKSGAAVRLESGSFLLGEGATITANEKGWAWFAGTDPYQRFAQGDAASGFFWTRAMGPGGDTTSGTAYNVGAGHGADGQNVKSYGFGKAYGNAYAPFLPGSPNGCYNWTKEGKGYSGPGGGTVWILCNGLCEMYGTITANGKTRGFGTPSGGSVWIAAKGFKSGPAASIEATGGMMETYSYSSLGAGGRVSLAIGLTAAERDALAAGTPPAELGLAVQDTIDLVAVSVAGGLKKNAGTYGNSGTATTVVGSDGFINVSISGSPVNALGVDPANGTEAYEKDAVITFTAPAYGEDPAVAGVRYPCLGYVVSDASGEVKRGEGRSVDVTIANGPMSVVWQWGAAERRALVRKPEHGKLLLDNVQQDGDAVQWPKGTMLSVAVVPDEGYEFVCWEGNVPLGCLTDNPLAADVTRPLDVTPVLRLVEAPTTRTWNGTGDWKDASKWTPQGNIPGWGDTVVIAGGTCTVSNGLTVAALEVAGGALKVGTAGDADGELSVVGDAQISGGTVTLGYGARYSFANNKQVTTPPSVNHVRLSVGGNLALSGAAKLDVSAGPVTEAYTFATGCGFVTVGGALTLDGTSVLSLNSDYLTGGSVRIDAKSFVLGETAKVDAKGKGFMWLNSDTPPLKHGVSFDVGGSHGGVGGANGAGSRYDFELAPVMPGAANGSYSEGQRPGGGVVRIHAKTMAVDGTIDARANGKTQFGGPAGGSIWLTADAFSFGTNMTLTVRGDELNGSYSSYGGGGRIAIGYKMEDARLAELAETGTWTGFKARRQMSLGQFCALYGVRPEQVDVHWGGPSIEARQTSLAAAQERYAAIVEELKRTDLTDEERAALEKEKTDVKKLVDDRSAALASAISGEGTFAYVDGRTWGFMLLVK